MTKKYLFCLSLGRTLAQPERWAVGQPRLHLNLKLVAGKFKHVFERLLQTLVGDD